ncbi:MAG TPA: FliG C-terminal domain-containing protein [bacterium]|nr:FliG C-terminal domain-containing protein [bacterium]
MEQAQNNRLRTVAALAVLRGGGDASDMAEHLNEAEGKRILRLMSLYSDEPDAEVKMEHLLRQMVASERFSSIGEVHPAWVLERLREEPPRVVGIILRSLPSKHVRYLLKNLPPMLKAALPDMVESFAVARPVLETIRRRFESHFLPMRVSRAVESPGFEHLYFLKVDELCELIREIGLTELAIALSGLQGKTLHAVFNRLPLKDAKRLQRRMRETGEVSPDLFRQARYTILEVEGDHVGPDRMLMRVGIAALASAMDREHGPLVKLVMQRMEPADGYLLKRSMDERRLRFSSKLASERQGMILEAVGRLAREGRIDPSWTSFAEAAGGDESPIELQSADQGEETATVNVRELA